MGRNANPKLARVAASLCFLFLTLVSSVAEEPKAETHHSAPASSDQELTLDGFLDQLMIAESGGDDLARNPKSTALGAFQFISSTFLRVVRRHFANETASLSIAEILRLRTDRDFARKAAEAYTKDNAYHLASHGLPTSFPNLRLAYLVGPSGAVKLLQAKPEAQVETILSAAALRANPFMNRMTVADLVAKAARDLSVAPDTQAGLVTETAEQAKKRPVPCCRPMRSRTSELSTLASSGRSEARTEGVTRGEQPVNMSSRGCCEGTPAPRFRAAIYDQKG